MILTGFTRNRLLATSLSILFLLSLASSVPFSNAQLSATDFIEELTTAPLGDKITVATDSSSRLFLGANNDIYRSLDNGATWTKVLDMPNALDASPRLLFVNRADYIFAVMFDTMSYFDLYRSVDHGTTWLKIMDNIPGSWHMSEAPNGDLYFNTYSYSAYIYKSTDNGASFSIFYNLSKIVDHFHWVEVSPAGKIYVATGDGIFDATLQRYKEKTLSWDILANTSSVGAEYQTVPIFFDNDYAYFFGDGQRYCYRMANSGNGTQDFEILFDLYQYMTGTTNFAYEGAYVNGVYWFGTDNGQLWASWDGKHWVKLYDSGVGGLVFSISRKGYPLYFIDAGSHDKLFRLNVQKDDVIHFYYNEYNYRRGDVENAENYVLEQRVWNGSTDYLNLANVALSNVKVSIKGLSRTNSLGLNSGFEWNDMTGWVTTGTPHGEIVSDTSANGTRSYRVRKSISDPQMNSIRPFSPISSRKGDIAILSFYAKANASTDQAIQVLMFNGSGGSPIDDWDNIKLATDWRRYNFWHAIPTISNIPTISWIIYYKKADVTTWIDSVMWGIDQTQILYGAGGATIEGITYLSDGFKHPPYFEGTQNTESPNVTINGQSVLYVGILSNGTESAPTNLAGILTGACQVIANIHGSGQAILRINATRIFYEDSTIFQGRKDTVYYGRYYGTFAPNMTTTDLIAVTNLQTNVTSLSYTEKTLRLKIHSPPQTNSTALIYCNDKGPPQTILCKNADLSWTYNTSTTTLTLEIASNGDAEILFDWRMPGDINGDGVVDASDVARINRSYGSKPEQSKWDPLADLNRDDLIDCRDLLIVGRHYGNTAT